MPEKKYCFLNPARPCDLTCKAAFEVDDPVDNIDCTLLWMAYHLGEGLVDLRNSLEGSQNGPGGAGPGLGGFPGFGTPPPKGPKGASNN
jgi:hypothetical protein